mgnify:CR=1 FL=1
MARFKRIFVIVIDSLGIGEMADSADFGDIGVNTLGHISQSRDLQYLILQSLEWRIL